MNRIVNNRKSFYVQGGADLTPALDYVREELEKQKVNRKLIRKAELLCEETIVMLSRHAPEDARLGILIRRFWGDVSIHLTMKGDVYDPYSDIPEETDADALLSEDAIRSILLRAQGEKYKYRNKRGVNHVQIQTGQGERRASNITFIALALGLLFGLLTKLVLPQSATDALCTYLFDPVKTMFMNALKIVIAPVVFFSIATCFSQFQSLSDFGKIGAKAVGLYLLTTVIAECIALSTSALIRPGAMGFALSEGTAQAAIAVDTSMETGLLHMIVNIVPSNFLAPFLESNTLQIIFLAVLCGIALGMIGQYSSVLKELFEALNSLFLTITSMIARFIPLAAFISVTMMVIKMGGDSLLSVLGVFGLHVLSVMLMMCAYAVLILLLGRLNPFVFFRNIREGMLTSFTLSSSSAAMPTNLSVCIHKLGISPKVANFTIPLGATINMDGFSIFLTVTSLFLARAYGVGVDASGMLTIAVTIILLSLGAPGVPGSSLVCLGIVLKTLNVPVEAMGLVIPIYPVMDMFNTLSNTTGDMAASLIVSKSENLLDLDIYHRT